MTELVKTTPQQEVLYVENFAGLGKVEIELSRMNIFIGPQASGKSVCAKLLFFFKQIISRTATQIVLEVTKPMMRAEHREQFLNYFPASSWSQGAFRVKYYCGDLWIEVRRKGVKSTTVEVMYSEAYDALLQDGRKTYKRHQSEDDFDKWDLFELRPYIAATAAKTFGSALGNSNYFIPAGRSFFSTLQSNVFSFMADNVGIDPFLAEFGRLYERIRKRYTNMPVAPNGSERHLFKRMENILCGNYYRIGIHDFIQSEDGRTIAVRNSSSGQQEALPLALTLVRLMRPFGATETLIYDPDDLPDNTLFVEEPEAHLYPEAQREIVHLLADVSNLASINSASQFVITTHSPYILSALNNLMYGEQVARQAASKQERVVAILGGTNLVDPANVRAYAFGGGQIKSIISSDTGLVKASALDSVSGKIAQEFEALVDVAYDEQAA